MHHTRSVPGVPYDPQRGVIPNRDGHVLDDSGAPLLGVYVVGWAKRGARGVIGTNRTCSTETVVDILTDFDSGTLRRRVDDTTELEGLLDDRGATPLSYRDWCTIDVAERTRGQQHSRPGIKLSARADMLATVRRGSLPISSTHSGIQAPT